MFTVKKGKLSVILIPNANSQGEGSGIFRLYSWRSFFFAPPHSAFGYNNIEIMFKKNISVMARSFIKAFFFKFLKKKNSGANPFFDKMRYSIVDSLNV